MKNKLLFTLATLMFLSNISLGQQQCFTNLFKITVGSGTDNFEILAKGLKDKLTDSKLAKAFVDDFLGEDWDIFIKNPELVDSWKTLYNLGDNAFDQLRKDPDFLKKFDDVTRNGKLNDHTFKGEVEITGVNDAGKKIYKVTGVHSNKAFADGTVRVKPGTQVTQLVDGFYKAKVEKQIDGFVNDQGTNWKVKKKLSTFYPDNWSPKKIQAEIAHAFKNKILDAGNKFHGFTTGGKKITMFLDGARGIKSAFPDL